MLTALHPSRQGTLPGAAREAHKPWGVSLQVPHPRARGEWLAAIARPRAGMSQGEEAAEIAVARPVLTEQRHVRGVLQRELATHDRAESERRRRPGHLHGTVEAIVVAHGHGLVAELGGGRGHVGRMRSPIEKRVRRMRVQLGVDHD